MKRLMILFLIISVALTSCSSKHETNVEKGNREKILYIGNGNEPETLDPHLSTGSPEYNIQLAIFEGLVTKDEKTLAIKPAIAQSWEISDDQLTYIFTLRDDARWSNGDSVVAQDFVDSLRRILSPALGSRYAYMIYYVKNAERYFNGEITDFSEVGISALGDFKLKITLENATPFFLQLLDHHTYYPVNKKNVEAHGDFLDHLNPWTRPENFVGNGPFTIDVWDVNRAIEVKRNEYYWNQDNIHLNRIVFFPIEDKIAEDRAFRSGQIHLTYTPQFAPEKIAVYKEKNPEVLRIVPTYASYYYLINTTKPPLDDARVRRALAMAIDRNTLVESVMKGGEPPAYSLVPIEPDGFHPQQHFEFNVEKARELLSEAGYPNGEGFPATELLYNNDDVHRKVSLAIQQMLKTNLNINVRLTNQEWKVYLSSRKSLNYDIARAGWIGDFLDPANFFDTFLSYSGNNHSGWKNEAFDRIIEKTQTTTDRNERFELFEKANKIMAEEMPLIPLFYYSDVNLVSTVVKGWHDNVKHYHNYRGVRLEPDSEP